jgi:hypothetical protein
MTARRDIDEVRATGKEVVPGGDERGWWSRGVGDVECEEGKHEGRSR